MLQKNIAKQERKNRDIWVGYYPRKTPTKKQLMDRQSKKHKNKLCYTPVGRADFCQFFGSFL